MAQRRAYALLEPIRFDGMQYRTDIGYRAVGHRNDHRVAADAGHSAASGTAGKRGG